MPLTKHSLESLIEASPDMVVATDAQGRIAYYNDGARDNLGYARAEVIGEHVTRIYPSLEEAKRVMAAMRDPQRDGRGRIVNFPTRLVAKDGHEVPVAISGTILYEADGKEEGGTIGFCRDITDLLHKDQLAVLGEIAVGLSHEINNPLAVIRGQLALLEPALQGAGDPRSAARLDSILFECKRIEALLLRLNQMAEHEEYASIDYLAGARMIDLGERRRGIAGKRVLVVDDDPGVRDTISDVLRAEGCEVTSAVNGRRALEQLEREPFDFVVSDVVMPEMDGYELFKAAQRIAPQTHVVLMTAFYYDKDHILKRSRMAGLEGVLFKKPVDPERLRQTLEKLLEPRETK